MHLRDLCLIHMQLHAEDIGFVLSEKNISALSNNYVVTVCLFLYDLVGYIILAIALVIVSWIKFTVIS